MIIMIMIIFWNVDILQGMGLSVVMFIMSSLLVYISQIKSQNQKSNRHSKSRYFPVLFFGKRVSERVREREREREWEWECVCVCVCVRKRERERERDFKCQG